MPKLYAAVLSAFILAMSLSVSAQVPYTSNDINPVYEGRFRPGVNLGYLPPWNTFQLGDLAAGNPAIGVPGIGARSTRPGLFDKVLDEYGYGLNVDAYDYFRDLGMSELTAIVGFPSDRHRDWADRHCPTTEKWNALFKGIYEPIWDDGSDGTPYNEDNEYAAYMYQIVTTYTDDVRFWEIWNEPGLYTGNDSEVFWGEPDYPGSWWVNDPDPCDYSIHAPIEHFIRTLRISYEIIKTISPDDYVAIAGVGSQSFLDALLRNSDNPVDGSITPDYPNLGGAYIDVLGFHTYPHLDGSTVFGPDNYYERHSDGAADGLINRRLGGYQQVLYNYGYDGITYPKKQHICTEINVPREIFSGSYFGGAEEVVNFIGKALIAIKTNDVHQMHVYSIADKVDEQDAGFEFDLMGLYKKLEGVSPYNQELNNEGIAYKTVADLIYPTDFDDAHTQALNAQPGTRAYAFAKTDGGYVYALWAETQTDLSENASAKFSFPAALNLGQLTKYEWDYSQTTNTSLVDPTNIQLDARPVYFVSEGNGTPNTNPVPNLTTASNTVSGNFDVTVQWSERVDGLSLADFIVTNGDVISLRGTSDRYELTVAPVSSGIVTVRLPAGAAKDLTDLPSLASNTLNVTSSTGGGGSGSNDADIELSIVGDATTVARNTDVVFLITATNTGLREGNDIRVEFPLPQMLSFVSSVESQGVYSSWDANWDIGTLGAGESATLEVTLFNLSDDIRTAFTQVINMRQTDPDSSPGNGVCCVANEDDEAVFTINGTAPTQSADLSLTMSSPQMAVNSDGTFDVLMTVINQGPDPTSGISTEIELPTGLTIISSNIPSGTNISGSRWNISRLSVNQGYTLELTFRTITPAAGAIITAEIASSSQPDPDSTPNNGAPGEDDRGVLVITGSQPNPTPDISLTLTADRTVFSARQDITFTAQIVNSGSAQAENVEVHFPRPVGMVYTNHNSSRGNYDLYFETWTLPTVAPGETATLQLTLFTMRGDPAITAFTQVSGSDTGDSDSTPNNRLCCTPIEDDEAMVRIAPSLIRTPGIRKLEDDYFSGGGIPANTFRVHSVTPVGTQGVTLAFSTELEQTNATLVDNLGRVVRQVTLAQGSGSYREYLDLSDLAPGMYNLVVDTTSGKETVRIVHM
ncbi:MAG: T9SS type A sorting domain-containing protein [Saprospiraceae bacterium]